jgi:hypothetical protein
VAFVLPLTTAFIALAAVSICSSCHSERSEEPPHFAFASSSFHNPKRTVISTESCSQSHREQRSGEIRFSTSTAYPAPGELTSTVSAKDVRVLSLAVQVVTSHVDDHPE